MSEYRDEDGRLIPELKPVQARCVRLDPEAWDLYDRQQQDDSLERFESEAHAALVAIKNVCEASDVLGILTELQRDALATAWAALNEFFGKNDNDDGGPF